MKSMSSQTTNLCPGLEKFLLTGPWLCKLVQYTLGVLLGAVAYRIYLHRQPHFVGYPLNMYEISLLQTSRGYIGSSLHPLCKLIVFF